MKKWKTDILLKCILTGVIYAVTTCIVQVPVANLLFSVLKIQPKASIADEMLPILLLSIFVVGIAMALFYYLDGHLFAAKSKWVQGMKFTIFVYVSNYIPQVFFLDANKGLEALLSGGFPVVQVELFDFIILMITDMVMVAYMPCRHEKTAESNNRARWKCFCCGVVFAVILVALQEGILPMLGMQSMATGLNVLDKNLPFFYGVMLIGFILAGALVSHYAMKAKSESGCIKQKFCLEYGILIWCAFDLTMIPLGFGVVATAMFIIISMLSFLAVEVLCIYSINKKW